MAEIEDLLTSEESEGELERAYEEPPKARHRRTRLRRRLFLAFGVVVATLVLLVAFGCGVLLGWGLFHTQQQHRQQQQDWGGTVSNGGRSVDDWLDEFISAQNIKDNLK